MSVKERVEFLLKQTNLSQSEFASKSGYSRAVLSNFLTGKTDKPRIDLLEAIKKVFPTFNLNWLITGQGEIWDGPPPTGLKDIQPSAAPAPNQELFNQLLVQKLQEVARELKTRDPEAYRKLGLEELVDKAGGKG